MFKIWCVEPNGVRELVRVDVTDPALARELLSEANRGAALHGECYRYVAEPPVEGMPSLRGGPFAASPTD